MSNLDVADLQGLFDGLRNRDWSGQRVELSWIGRLYHVTDINNAVSIIRHKRIYSRNKAIALGLMVSDNASASVLEATPDWVGNFARLYFRPRVPAFYRNEGFICSTDPSYRDFGAHCPIPVAFEFDAASVLTQNDCIISNGNLAALQSHRTCTGEDINFLRSLDFEKVYSDGYFPKGDQQYKNCRHAEVVIPEFLSITSSLRRVICRSEAEAETLRSLSQHRLPDDIYRRIVVDTRSKIFHRHRPFIQTVQVAPPGFVIVFHVADARSSLPFALRVAVTDADRGRILGSKTLNIDLAQERTRTIAIRDSLDVNTFGVELFLDERLAYKGQFVYLKGSGIVF